MVGDLGFGKNFEGFDIVGMRHKPIVGVAKRLLVAGSSSVHLPDQIDQPNSTENREGSPGETSSVSPRREVPNSPNMGMCG